jgi:uncharacterized integral membrane protein
VTEATPQPSSPPGPSGPPPASPGLFSRMARAAARHPMRVVKWIAGLLVAIVLIQNLEPTSFHVLFWQIAQLPKLVALLIAMAIGALAWEVLRRALLR